MLPVPVLPGDGEGVGDCDGIDMPFMFIPCMSVFFGAGRALFFRRVVVMAFDLAFRFAFGLAFAFDIFMPGMSCMSCP
jgi:hypothetical protein